MPGQGASEVGDAPLDADHVLAWLNELIEQTCSTPPTLVGYALGGAIAAMVAHLVAGGPTIVLPVWFRLCRLRNYKRFTTMMSVASVNRNRTMVEIDRVMRHGAMQRR